MAPEPSTSRTKALVRLVAVVTVVLVVPLATTLVWSDWGGAWLARWHTTPPPPGWIAAGLVGVLAADILLPVPSGPLITLAASELGTLSTMWWAWCGLMLGCLVAFSLARWGGPRLASRIARSNDIESLRDRMNYNLPTWIILTRPLPMIAEIVVLVVGVLGCRWRTFLWSVAVGNAVVAGAFSLLGSYAATHEHLVIALAMSFAGPLALAGWLKRRWQA